MKRTLYVDKFRKKERRKGSIWSGLMRHSCGEGTSYAHIEKRGKRRGGKDRGGGELDFRRTSRKCVEDH